MRASGGGMTQYAWNAAKNRAELRIAANATDQFIWNADPAFKADHTFPCLWEDGTNQALHVDGGLFLRTVVGAGSFPLLTGLHGGISSVTGVLLSDYCLMRGGGPAGVAYCYNVSEDINACFRFRLPNVGDLVNHVVLIGFQYDANNYIGMLYDSTVDANWRFVTRAAAASTPTIIVPGDTAWHTVYMVLSADSCKCIYDGAATVTHTTNIPANNLCIYLMNQNQTVGNAMYLECQRIKVVQDAP